MDEFLFTREDLLEINRNESYRVSRIASLSEGSRRVLRETHFSRDEMNEAFAAARLQLSQD